MYQMPVRAIKNILRKELDERKQSFYNAYPNFIMSDTQKEMIYIAHSNLSEILDKCEDYASLEDFISYSGYRMSLEDWINSL
jgi:hypothetical protein